MNTKELLNQTFEELHQDEEMVISGGYCPAYRFLSVIYNTAGLSCNLGTTGPNTVYTMPSGRCTAR